MSEAIGVSLFVLRSVVVCRAMYVRMFGLGFHG